MDGMEGVGVEDRGREELVWVKGCLINLKQVQRSLQNANETISLIGGVGGRPVGGSGRCVQIQRGNPV